jgi:hypothetical protein
MEPLTLDVDPTRFGISPTDLSQFIRLDQCERYLRLRLHERASGKDFMAAHGVRPQAIPPLLTRSGRTFESQVEESIQAQMPTIHLAAEAAGTVDRGPDNARIIAESRRLASGSVVVLFQARIHVEIDGWQLTGDADVVRLERDADGALTVLIADIKSSSSTRVEHRLQVAFYHEMLDRLLAEAGITAEVRTGILYRGVPAESTVERADTARIETERETASRLFGVDALLEDVVDADAYREAVRDLVTGPDALARQVATAPGEESAARLGHHHGPGSRTPERAAPPRGLRRASRRWRCRDGRWPGAGHSARKGGALPPRRDHLARRPTPGRVDSPCSPLPQVEAGPDRRALLYP